MKRLFLFILLPLLPLITTGCAASHYLKGMQPNGEKAYIGSVPIDNDEAFQTYLKTSRSEVDKVNYLFKRVTSAKDLTYYHDDNTYTWLEAYRGGMWLLRNRYKGGMDARTFIRDHVWFSETSGKPHLVEFPDRTIQIGYYVLMNELELLEQTAAKYPPQA